MRKSIVLLVVCALVVGLVASLSYAKLADSEYKKLEKNCKKALVSSEWNAAIALIPQVAKDNSKRAVKFLLKLSKELSLPLNVFNEVKEALAGMSDPEAISAMCKVMKSGSWQIKAMLAEIFGNFSDNESLSALNNLLLKAKKMEVLRETILAVSKRKSLDSVSTLIDLFEKMEKSRDKGTLWIEVRKVLYKLTGKDYEKSEDWKKFWDELSRKQVEKDVEDGKITQEDVSEGDLTTSLGKKAPPKFFGTEVRSNNVIFVMDTSGSMLADNNNPKARPRLGQKSPPSARIEMVKRELVKVIQELDKGAMFNIITFNSGVSVWKKGGLVKANATNRAAAVQYVQNFRAAGVTFTDAAIKKAFEDKKADSMFLLTDGAPTHSMLKDPASAGCIEFLKRLAEQNGGKFKGID
jgi:hypothetical protein